MGPLKVKVSMKFQGVDFLISKNSSTANVLNNATDRIHSFCGLMIGDFKSDIGP